MTENAPKVLIATEKPFSADAKDAVVKRLEDAGLRVEVLEKYPNEAALRSAIADAQAVMVRSDDINAGVLAAGKALKLVVRAGAGYDNVDCAAAKAKDIAVMNTPGQNSNAVAELAFGMMIYAARGGFDGKSGTELRGKTLGIHALGNVGMNVLRLAKGFEMEVSAFDPFVDAKVIEATGAKPVQSVEALYKSCQYVSLHIPNTPVTKSSIGEKLLMFMPKGGTLVNTARKEVIDEAGLLAAMRGRSDLQYLTDIGPSEPTEAALKTDFAQRFFMTPKKMGAQTEEANFNAGLAAANQIIGFLQRGERVYIVN